MDQDFTVVGIGYSAGGLQAIKEFMKHLVSDSGAAFVIIHHMSRKYKSKVGEILSKHTKMPIHSIYDSITVEPNHIYVLDENQYVTIADNHLYFAHRSLETDINVAINTFFFSMANEKKGKAIGIILSGSGSDGAKGCHAIHEAGGHLLIQEPDSAIFQFMPINAINANKPNSVGSPAQLANDLLKLIYVGHNE